MADFSLTTLFVVPTSQTALPPAGVVSTQDLGAGQVAIFKNDYLLPASAAELAAAPYFYIAQGRANSYLQGSIRSDKIKGCATTGGCNSNVTEFYKVQGCGTAAVQITEISGWNVQCGDVITITLRAHSSYIDTLYFNGLTKSITVQAPCCACGADPCAPLADIPGLIDKIIAKFREQAPGNNFDNTSFNTYYTFERIGTTLRISGKALTKYGVPCDVAAFPHEYDRMWFRTFVYEGAATTADFLVADNCNIVANPVIVQRSSYPTGTAEEIKQLEKNYYSYQAGYLKHLYRMAGYNQNYDSNVDAAAIYTTYYIKYNELDRSAYQWGDYIPEDSMSIIAVNILNTAFITALEALLVGALGLTAGPIAAVNGPCITTTSTTTLTPPTTTTTSSTLIP